MAIRPMGRLHGLLARPMGRTAQPSPRPCRHGTKASACHGPPPRPMTLHGHAMARGEAPWPAWLPHPLHRLSPWQLQRWLAIRAAAPRPCARSPGRRHTSSLWARGRAPPGRRRTGELRPKPASPPPGAPHQSGADAPAPPSPTDATRRHRRPRSTLGSAPEGPPPYLPHYHALCRRLPVLPCCLRHAVLSARHNGPCVVPWAEGLAHGTDKHGMARPGTAVPTRHGGHL
jgi:hypothetical protein